MQARAVRLSEGCGAVDHGETAAKRSSPWTQSDTAGLTRSLPAGACFGRPAGSFQGGAT
jgi:hypothetical protein